MSPIEKAESALNTRIERLQASLRAAQSEPVQRYLLQSVIVCIGIGEALTDYVRTIGQYSQRRHGELKQAHAVLSAQHADLLKSGNELLARLKANPTDRAIRKEIEAAQRNMAAIQKSLRRGANSLQREVAPSMAMIDKLALGIRRLCEADQIDALKRALKLILGGVRELYHTQPTLDAKDIIDTAAWEKSAGAAIDHATEFNEAYALAGHQAMRALDTMTLAIAETPPRTSDEAMARATEAVAARLKAITTRLTTQAGPE